MDDAFERNAAASAFKIRGSSYDPHYRIRLKQELFS